jgi:hypothetical protein
MHVQLWHYLRLISSFTSCCNRASPAVETWALKNGERRRNKKYASFMLWELVNGCQMYGENKAR